MGITPATIFKSVQDILEGAHAPGAGKTDRNSERRKVAETAGDYASEQPRTPAEFDKLIAKLEDEMFTAAKGLEFEKAASLRDQLQELQNKRMLV